ncbi:MAG: 4-hydroxybenzoate--CoA ligase [Proteobacteria bacterium]|nr:MAG: 4-hydroxybenzoate--CoA ligase [Pseudomonadota bacterium]
MNAAEHLLAPGHDGSVALICGSEAVTYAELRDRVARTAGWLQRGGVVPGDRVIVIGADSIAWVVAWLGAIWTGAVAVGLNPRLKGEELGEIFGETAARVCFADTDAAAAISTVSLQHPLKLIGLQSGAWDTGLALDAVQRRADEPAFWIYSSGTTGRAKAVVHAHRSVDGCIAFASGVLSAGAGDRFFATSRLFFAYSLANCLLAGLRLGASVILDSRWPDPDEVANVVAQTRPTLLFSVPTFYHQLLSCGASGRIAVAGVRAFVSAGESLPPQIGARWRETTGSALYSGYGMTETLALVLFRDSAAEESAAPAPLTDVRADPTESADQPVRLWFRHPSLALGYHRWPDLQKRNFAQGWCSAGDLFFPAGDRRWLFAGRDDSRAKVAGRWVSTTDLQQELAAELAALIQELAVVALSGAEGLIGMAVFAVPREDRENAARAAMDEQIIRLPAHRRPRWQYWLTAMPRTATGKLQVAQLKAIHAASLKL